MYGKSVSSGCVALTAGVRMWQGSSPHHLYQSQNGSAPPAMFQNRSGYGSAAPEFGNDVPMYQGRPWLILLLSCGGDGSSVAGAVPACLTVGGRAGGSPYHQQYTEVRHQRSSPAVNSPVLGSYSLQAPPVPRRPSPLPCPPAWRARQHKPRRNAAAPVRLRGRRSRRARRCSRRSSSTARPTPRCPPPAPVRASTTPTPLPRPEPAAMHGATASAAIPRPWQLTSLWRLQSLRRTARCTARRAGRSRICPP
jgi:hypothetical protein